MAPGTPGLETARPPSPDVVHEEPDDVEQHEVDKLIDVREVDGAKQYRVRWRGFTARHDQWVDEEELNAPALVQAFEQVRANARDPASEGHMTRRRVSKMMEKEKLTSGMSGSDTTAGDTGQTDGTGNKTTGNGAPPKVRKFKTGKTLEQNRLNDIFVCSLFVT